MKEPENRATGRWQRIILHADMDAFYAAVEQRDNPALRGKPVLVGGTSNRGVVSTASYEARPSGARSGMPMVEARRRCPEAIVVSPDFERYQEASRRVMEVFASYSPLVEPLSLDEAFMDMSGAQGLFGGPAEMGRAIKRDVLAATDGLTVSVGAAATKFVAKVASDHRKPDGLTVVPPGTEHDFLWPQPVSRLWGVGPKTRERLEDLGLKLIGDVARCSRDDLEARFGVMGPHLHRLAWADDSREVVPEREVKSVGAERTLEQNITGERAVRSQLRGVAERVARRLRRKGLVAGGVRVKLKTSRFRLWTRQTGISPPTDSAKGLLEQAHELLPAFDLSHQFRLVGIAAFDLAEGAGAAQQELFVDESRERVRRLDRVLDAVQDKFGDDAVRRGSDEDTE